MSREVSACARVVVTLEVTVSNWGDDCTIKQVNDQARREAIQKVERELGDSCRRGIIEIVGKPIVKAIITVDNQ